MKLLKEFFASCSTSSGKKVKGAKQKYSTLAPKPRPIQVSKSQPNLEQYKLSLEPGASSKHHKGSKSDGRRNSKSKSKFYDDVDLSLRGISSTNTNGILDNIDNYDLSSISHALDPLKVGDRVVWVRESSGTTTQEPGTVRWLGVIEDEEIAGIEFDRRLRLGSGWYRQRQLFSCAVDHGGLVAVAGLILEEDLENPTLIRPSSPSTSPSSSASSSLTKSNKRRSFERLDQIDSKRQGDILYEHQTHTLYPKSESSSPSWSSTSSGGEPSSQITGQPFSYTSEYSQGKQRYQGKFENKLGWNSQAECGHQYQHNPNFDQFTFDRSKSPEEIQAQQLRISLNHSGCGEYRACRETDLDAVPLPIHQSHSAPMPSLPFIHPPLGEEEIEKINGRPKGIQGHCNSCYLDATLFSMFSFTSVFDTILLTDASLKNGSLNDKGLAERIQRILREQIVNPLRKDYLTPAANVMKLRETMYHLDDKLTSEEMDPQEFLQILFHDVLKLKEFISLSSGESDFFHQVLCDVTENDREQIPTVQQLFEQSLRQQKLKLTSIPSPALILQMPRSGNKYKTYNGILPNLTIDITDLIEDTPRECAICGELATHECPDCYGHFPYQNINQGHSGADSMSFCDTCVSPVHNKPERSSHKSIVPIKYSFPTELYFQPNLSNPNPNYSNNNFLNSNGVVPNFLNSLPVTRKVVTGHPHRIPRVTMDLFAVICIETSHFVSFVKCGVDQFAPWVFFDSMADRCENVSGKGHNIPQVKMLPKMGSWLADLESRTQEQLQNIIGNTTPELKRLLSDPYICLYYSPQQAMYI